MLSEKKEHTLVAILMIIMMKKLKTTMNTIKEILTTGAAKTVGI